MKKTIAGLMGIMLTMSFMVNLGIGKNVVTAYAAEDESAGADYFLQGTGTGEAFEASDWDVSTIYTEKTIDRYKGAAYKGGIVANNHSGNNESVIRLINGVELETDVMYDENNYLWDYRAGAAVMQSTVKLKNEGEFSAKFTVSMPDSVTYRGWAETGGDGITFLITSSDTIQGTVGGGIGYTGIDNSIAIELDSFYNTGNAGNQYDPDVPDGFDDNDREDHVAVLVDGVNTTKEAHIGTSFLYYNGYQEGFTGDSNLAVAGEEVDTRLFTVWVEYDGEDLYVRYAKGDFATAVRPTAAQIVVDDQTYPAVKARLDSFANQEVKVAFTAAIGDSKANHTIHSIGLVNEYLEDGITVPYTEEYYVEAPDAESGFITVNDKKYVKSKSNVVTNAALNTQVVINDLQSTYGDKYSAVDYSSKGYPGTAEAIETDGSTVLYQFYDIVRTDYTEKYIVKADNPAPGDVTIEIGGVTYKVLETVVVSDVPVDSKAEIRDKSQDEDYAGYEPVAPTTDIPSVVEDIDDDGNTVVYQIFKEKPEYSVKYYLEVDEGTSGAVKIGDKFYLEQVDKGITNKAATGTAVNYVYKDQYTAGIEEGDTEVTDSFLSFDGYTHNKDVTEDYGKIGGILTDEGVEIVIVYDKITVPSEPGEDPTEPTNPDEQTPDAGAPETGVGVFVAVIVLCVGAAGMIVTAGNKKNA